MLFVWGAIVLLVTIIAGALGFTDVAPEASKAARVVFYLLLALCLTLLLIGFVVVKKVTSFARGFGLNVNVAGLWGIMKWVQLLRKDEEGSDDETEHSH